MPDQQTQEWYTIQGKDGQWYKTQALNADQARAKFESKKLIDPKPVENQLPPYLGFTPQNVVKNVVEGAKGLVKGTTDLATDLWKNPNWIIGKDSTAKKFVFDPSDAERAKAAQEWKSGSKVAAAGHELAAAIPFVGPWAASLGEQAGKGDVGGATGQAIGTMSPAELAKVTVKAGVKGVQSFVDPVKNATVIAKLNQHALKMAEGGVKDPAAYAAIRVAKEQIHGNIESVYQQIDQAIKAREPLKQQALQKAIAAGAKIDPAIAQEMAQRIDEVRQNLIKGGTYGPDDARAVQQFIDQLDKKPDITGKGMVRRDWTNLQDVYDVTRTGGLLTENAKFESAPSGVRETIAKMAKNARAIAVRGIDQAAPDVARLSREQSELVRAREAANDIVIASRKGNAAIFRGIMSSNAPTLVGWIAARELLGMQAAVALGGVIVLKRLAESTQSRTYRAALRAKLLERQEAAIARSAGPTGAAGASSPQSGPQGPTGPQVPQAQQLTGGLGPQAAPQAGPLLAPQGGSPQAGTYFGPRAVSSMPGAEDLNKYPALAGKGVAVPGETDVTKAAQQAAQMTHPPTPSADELNARMRSTAQPARDTAILDQIKKEHPDWTLSQQLQEAAKRANPPKAAAGPTVAESNISSKHKAMLDRLDDLMSRTPRSGAENNAIRREIAEVKKILSGEATGKEASAINKRIADRERLAAKRAEVKATSGGATTGPATASQAAAPQASPEMRAMALDAGYKKLASYDGGPEMVKALQKQAKELRTTEYDEVQALADALQVLREVEGH